MKIESKKQAALQTTVRKPIRMTRDQLMLVPKLIPMLVSVPVTLVLTREFDSFLSILARVMMITLAFLVLTRLEH